MKRFDRCPLGNRQPFEIVRHRINYCIHSIVTSPICTVVSIVIDTMDDLIDMMDFDFHCNCTDRNRHGCSEFHSNPSYMNTVSVHWLRISHFVIKSIRTNELKTNYDFMTNDSIDLICVRTYFNS